MKPVIIAPSGLVATAAEKMLWRTMQPAGFILVGRNCESAKQVKELIESFRATVQDGERLIMIDHEGGRVQWLKPPHMSALPPAHHWADVYWDDPQAAEQGAYQHALLSAHELKALGFTLNAAPVLDVEQVGQTTPRVANRTYGPNPDVVIALGRMVIQGLRDGGILPLIKHMPGHGRGFVDSHEQLPVIDVDLATLADFDLRPFKALAGQVQYGMTAHIRYTQLDVHHPATHSAKIIQDVIRGHIGFEGTLLTDDLAMNALSGSVFERAQKALAAGCDLAVYCGGNMADNESLLKL